MAYNLKRTPLADEDYEKILRRTWNTWGRDQYAKYRVLLRDAVSAIAEDIFLLTSKGRDDLFDGARLYPVGVHYLLYSE